MCQYHMYIIFPIGANACGHIVNLSHIPMEERLKYLSRPALCSVECSVRRQKRLASYPSWWPRNATSTTDDHDDLMAVDDVVADDRHVRPRRRRIRSPSTTSICTTIQWKGTLAPRWVRRPGDGDCPDCVQNARDLAEADAEWDDTMADLAPGGVMPIRAWERRALTATRDDYMATGGRSRWDLVSNGRVEELVRWQRCLVERWLVNLKGTRAKGDPAGEVEEGEIAGGSGGGEMGDVQEEDDCFPLLETGDVPEDDSYFYGK